MPPTLTLIIYRALLPLLFLVAFPGWIIKMIRRNGLNTALHERLGIYLQPADREPTHAIHLHAISVGETMLALKLARAWRKNQPNTTFVIATGTATGHHLATNANLPDTRVTYSPLDFAWMVRKYLNRFQPAKIILIEAEAWPNLLRLAEKQHIPVHLANARVSPRSEQRYLRFVKLISPFFSKLTTVCIQEKNHRHLWQQLGIPTQNIHLTGSLKFDPLTTTPPPPSPEFEKILASYGPSRPLILAASTFPGEETLIAAAIHQAHPKALAIIVPRHAERRNEAHQTLTQHGFQTTLRTTFTPPTPHPQQVLLIDTTGELATWTSHAHIVIIGKSFLHTGGQTPAEAILAHKPLILGPHMENFQPLANKLLAANAAILATTREEITTAIQTALDPTTATAMTNTAHNILSQHQGATQRHLDVLQSS